MSSKINKFVHRLIALISDPGFIKMVNILHEPNFFKIVGRTHYERWHSCFWGWLLDANGSHLLSNYVLTRFLLLLLDEKCLKGRDHENIDLFKILPTVEFFDIEVAPNEHVSTEASIKNVGRLDIFLTARFEDQRNHIRKLNIIFELKIDSQTSSMQSRKYSEWLYNNHPNDVNFSIYLLPKLLSSSKATVGDDRWYCMDYQLLNDKLLVPILEHPSLNERVKVFIIQYIKNLKISYRGIKMAITDEEKKLALELYEKYSDVFDSIFDVLQEENVIDFSTSELPSKGRKSGRIVAKIDGKMFDGKDVKELYRNVLKYLVDNDYVQRIPLPWGTGSKRHVISNEVRPTHPNGREFFIPVKYKGYALETHMARDRSMKVLDDLCKKLEIEFETIDV